MSFMLNYVSVQEEEPFLILVVEVTSFWDYLSCRIGSRFLFTLFMYSLSHAWSCLFTYHVLWKALKIFKFVIYYDCHLFFLAFLLNFTDSYVCKYVSQMSVIYTIGNFILNLFLTLNEQQIVSYFISCYSVDIYSSHEGQLYCKPHFRELFKPKAVVDDDGEPRKLVCYPCNLMWCLWQIYFRVSVLCFHRIILIL
jgi:hypothetical protein